MFSYTPKTTTKFCTFFALASKDKAFEDRAKNVQNSVGFLDYGGTWYFAFEIY